MPKPKSPFNEAVRRICEKHNGGVTYLEARPELEKLAEKMGFSLASTDEEIAHERARFDVTKCGWKKVQESGQPTPSRKPKVKNAKSRAAAQERRGPGRPRKNEAYPPAKYAPNGRRGRPRKTTAEDYNDLIAYLNQHGGSAAVRAEVERKRAEAARLTEEATRQEELLNRFEALSKLVSKLAA